MAQIAAAVAGSPLTAALLASALALLTLLPAVVPAALPLAPAAAAASGASLTLPLLEGRFRLALLSLALALPLLGIGAVLSGGEAGTSIAIGMGLWLPCLALGLVLERTRSLALALTLGALVAILLLIALRLLAGDWLELLSARQGEAVGAMLEGSVPAERHAEFEQALAAVARLAAGLLVASSLLVATLGLLLARFGQARLRRPGAFGEEFRALRFGRSAALVSLVALGLAVVPGVPLFAEIAMIVGVPMSLQGLAVLHELGRASPRWRAGLFMIYLLLGLALLQIGFALAMLGVLDNWLDFRRRRGAGQRPHGEDR